MKIRLSIFLLLGCCRLLQAQLPQYHAQVFGEGQGIAAGNIHSIFKDHQHFLWIAAGNTLQRFDGRNVRSWEFDDPIVQAVCDRGNRVWALSGGKVHRSMQDKFGFQTVPLDTSWGLPCVLFQLKNRPFCLLTNRGFFDFDEKNGNFRRLETPLPPAHFAPGSMRLDTLGTTVFYPGKDCYHAADLATGTVSTLPTSTRIASFCAFTPSLAAISYFDGVSVWLDFGKDTVTELDALRYGLSRSFHNPNLMDAVPLGDSLFLVTTRFGACTYDLRNDRFTQQRIFAEGKPIELEEALIRLFRDENGTFWAHNTTHVIAFNSLENTIGLLRNYHDEPGRRWSNRVAGFTEDGEGNIWFGGFYGFNKLDRATGQVENHPPAEGNPRRLSHVSVRGLAFDGHTLLLGPTLRGMWLYDPATDRYARPHWSREAEAAMEQEFVNGILPLRNGDFLICGSRYQFLLKKGSHQLDLLQFSDKKRNASHAVQSADGRVWLAAGQEVMVLDDDCNRLFTVPFPAERATSVFPTGNDSVLVGCEKGLYLLTPASESGKLVRLNSPLDNTIVVQIFRDKRGRFWFTSSNGLFLADAKLQVFRRFDFADNIQSRFFNPFSVLHALDGLVFLGGHNGINFFYPEKIELEVPPLAVSLQSLAAGDSLIWNPRSGLVLPHDQNMLTFEVDAPYFNNAAKLQYRYRLNPGGEWVNTSSSHSISLSKLPPGKYRLEVEASLAGMKWYAAAPFSFRIKPPFWKTLPFLAIVVAGALYLLWLFIRYRENLLKKRQQRALELEKLKSAALQIEVEAATPFRLAVPSKEGVHFFRPSEIIRLEAAGSYTEIYLTGGRRFVASTGLGEYEELLTQQGFLRTHKSHIVNPAFVVSIEHEGFLVLSDGSRAEVSRRRKEEILRAIKG